MSERKPPVVDQEELLAGLQQFIEAHTLEAHATERGISQSRAFGLGKKAANEFMGAVEERWPALAELFKTGKLMVVLHLMTELTEEKEGNHGPD